MTKKDYIVIARAISLNTACYPSDKDYQAIIKTVAETIARHMQRDNPRFDCEKFLTACGINK